MIKSAYLNGFKSIVIKKQAMPACPVGHAIIKVYYAGICGSDLLQYNLLREQSKFPLGHELSGKIEYLSENNNNLTEGDRVIISAVSGCNKCRACKKGNYNICFNRKFIPSLGPGAFSEYAIAPIPSIYPIPKSVSLKTASLTEPYSVALHALEKGKSIDKNKILIIGAGTIGLALSQLAVTKGYKEVLIIYRHDYQKRIAEKSGATAYDEKDFFCSKNFNFIVNTVPGSTAMALAIKSCASQGKIVICGGYSEPEIYLLREVVSREISIEGSICYSAKDILNVIKYMENNTVDAEKLITHKINFNSISEAFKIADEKTKNKSVKVVLDYRGN